MTYFVIPTRVSRASLYNNNKVSTRLSAVWVLLLFIFFAPALSSDAAPLLPQSSTQADRGKVRLYGRVTDSDGVGMDIVHVRLRDGSIGTLTNFKGEYELNLPAGDTMTVVFTSLGYKRLERQINTAGIQPDANGLRRMHLDVTLRTNTAVIGDVEVTAARQQSGTLEKIESRELQHLPSASGNAVEDLLGTMAGVNMNNELSSQYNVRGGSFDENLVYVGGVEVYRPQLIRSGQQEGLSFINPDMVADINFSTGGFGAEYGDKMSSVLDIHYKRPSAFEASASAGLMGGSLSLGQASGAFTQLHGVRYKRGSSLLSTLDTRGEYDPNFFDYQTYLTLGVGKDWETSFLGNISRNSYRFAPESRETSFGTMDTPRKFKVYFDGLERDHFDTYFAAWTWSYKGWKGTQLDLRASAFKTDEEVTYDISGEYWLDEATDGGQNSLGVGAYHEHARNYLEASVATLSLSGTTQLGYHKLSYGMQMSRERIDDRIAEWERRDSSGYTLPHTGNTVAMIYNLHSFYRHTSSRWSAYVQDAFGWNAWGGRMRLTAGIRFSYWDFNEELLCSPRAALTYRPEARPGWTFRLAGGLYYQAPFYKEYRLTYVDEAGNSMIEMNRDIRSQRSWQLVLGGDYTFKAYDRPFKFTAEGYYKGISNYIPYTVDNVQIRYAGYNNGTAFTTGLDLKLFGEFVEGTDSWISLSLMEAKETVDGLKTSRPTEQRYGLGLFFSDYFPGYDCYKVYLRGVFNDGLPFYSPVGGRASGMFRTPAYRRVDLGATRVWNDENAHFMRARRWRHVSELTLGLEIFNLLDINNTNSYYWVTAVDNLQYAVPNYLTGRMLNVNLGIRLR
jgi:hypothetical protein